MGKFESTAQFLVAYLCMSTLPAWAAKVVDEGEPVFVGIRLLPISSVDKRRQLWKELHTIAKPTSLRVAPGTTLADAIRKQCGSAPVDLVDFAVSLNAGTERGATMNTRELQFIPCPYWSFKDQPQPPSIRVAKGEQLQKILPFYMGTSGTDTLAAVRELNPRVVDASGNVIADGRIVLPYASLGTLFELQPQFQAVSPNTLGWLGDRTFNWNDETAYGATGSDVWTWGTFDSGIAGGDILKWSGKSAYDATSGAAWAYGGATGVGGFGGGAMKWGSKSACDITGRGETAKFLRSPVYDVTGRVVWKSNPFSSQDVFASDTPRRYTWGSDEWRWDSKPKSGVPGAATCMGFDSYVWGGDKPYAEVNRGTIRDAAPTVEKNITSVGRDAYRLVGEDGPDLSDPRKECNGPAEDTDWPVNMEKVLASFNTTVEKLKVKPRDKALALIVDTGLNTSDAIVATSLWVRTEVANKIQVRGAYYEGDLHGANMITGMGDIEPTPGYKFALHGTEVSRIFLGPSYRSISKIAMVAGAKVNEDQAPYKIALNSIPDSLKYAREIGVAALNVSVVIARKTPWLEDGLNAANYLVVAAAGNNSGFLEQQPLYPPAISTSRDHLLVVGAHDWKNRITTFSNRGPLVDLLAPGCAIPMMGADGKVSLRSGTSFAAPFVTLTATLLAHIGMRGSDLKNRILASTDFDPGLAKVVKYAGRLNIEKAVRVQDDAITANGADSPIFGRIENEPTWICMVGGEERAFNPAQVLKIIPHFPISNTKVVPVVWVRAGDNGALQEVVCDGELSGSVTFKAHDKDAATTYEWSELTEIVPKHGSR